MYFFLLLILTFTATAKQTGSFFIVRVGDEVTLPCENVSDGQNSCDRTNWSFIRSIQTVTLFEDVQLNAAINLEKLSLTASCSLVIKNVTIEDVGRYDCRQLTSGEEVSPSVFLSVIYLTEQKINDSVVLNCSVVDYNYRRHTVEWLYEGEANISVHTLLSLPASHFSVALKAPLHQNSATFRSKCKVTNNNSGKFQLFTISHPSKVQTTDSSWWPIVVSVASTSLLIIIVVFIKRKKTKGCERKSERDTAGPEGDLFYASVCHRKGTIANKKVSFTATHSTADLSYPEASSNQGIVYSTVKHKESDYTQ